ncbi:MAG: hypothetical protein J1E81_06030 [Eubacterium sp.]|nr:hypothetical protein [Eubacterium sp.]
MIKFIINTDKGYICEANAIGEYIASSKDNEFYRGERGKFFATVLANCSGVDKLGFTDNRENATKYSACIGNRVQEIVDRITAGYENIKTITVEIDE